ncbi:hypothetical protein H632_c1512p0, partial [Helicosporidium sp. ATCC 50920]
MTLQCGKAIFSWYFESKKLESAGRLEFAGQIVTDGVRVSVVL